MITITVEQITWIEAYGDYSKLHTAKGEYLRNHGISTLEEHLDPRLFIWVHRSFMINLKQISEIHRYSRYVDLKMNNGEMVRVCLSILKI